MLDIEEALLRVTAVSRLGRELSSLDECDGRVLAEQLAATTDLPAFDYSAMDGYALARSDLLGEAPWTLPVHGESRTGGRIPDLAEGSVCRIFTGAGLPARADAVVAQEVVQVADGRARFERKPEAWANVRRRGEDLRAGEDALREGTVLGPGQLALAAALERAKLWVARRPRVTIVSTGDELRRPGEPARPGSIPESNSVAIAALARRAGAQVTVAHRAPDNLAKMARLVSEASEHADLLITIGGVSVGDYDLVRPALEACGFAVDFHKVNIKPGKPLLFGQYASTRALGLPGNPVSAQVTFLLFGVPLLRALQGATVLPVPLRPATLTQPLRQSPGRHGFVRATLEYDRVTPLPNQASGAVTSMAWANALVHVPASCSGFEAGAVVSVIALDDV